MSECLTPEGTTGGKSQSSSTTRHFLLPKAPNDDRGGFIRKRRNTDEEMASLAQSSAAYSAKTDQVDLHTPMTSQKENGTVSSGADADDDFVELPPLCGRDPHQTGRPEPALVLFFEVLFPFLVAGLGMVFAGLVFDKVQHWSFYREAPQALILVPALLGLKGNLEMTLASRLSTQSNIGKMDSREQIYATVVANIALIETQAIVVTILATATAMAFAWIPRGEFDWGHAVLVGSAALTTASVASLVLSGVMVLVILVAKRYQVNPDNVAAPIAASMGDLTTLAVLSMVGNIFLSAHRTEHWLSICSILFFLMLLPACAIVAWRDANARQVLRYGWSPIIFSMMISSSGGFVLERAMRNFRQMALYQPVMNGVGGNLAAVAASKLSTFYHRTATLGTLPNEWSLRRFCSVTRAFFSSDEDSRAARVLLMLCVPGHMLFNWVIFLLHSQSGDYVVQGPLFSALYLTAALAQVTILLFLCQWLVPLMWLWRQNPDNAAIPYLTAMGDLLGTSFLFTAFSVLALLKPEELVSVVMSSTTTTTPLPPTAMPPG
ncbi:hypothetical protein GPALN_011975 [Globodera pallida]|uniref:Divalent cation transporter n=1 Tax=Globodera pallida TaxID=36090 RepID=A0A183BSB6_GLOPA|nr:hypothetical protein GPALN_011975 [Globodera pallida]